MVKILWFSNTPCNAVERLKESQIGGGWLQSLDLAIQDKIELHIAFYHGSISAPFKHLNTFYYPISSRSIKKNSIQNMLRPSILDTEDIGLYLEIIAAVKPDLIHIHGTENTFNCIIEQVSVPVVVSIQGNIVVYQHKYTAGIPVQLMKGKGVDNISSLKALFINKNFYHGLRLFKKMATRETRYLASTKFVIGRTGWDKRITSILAPKATYFHNDEILRNEFYTTQWKAHQDRNGIIIHSTNGNTPYKGFETICETLYILQQAGLQVEWRVAGIKEDDTIVRLVRKILGDRFPTSGLKLVGKISADELVDMLMDADVYVMPSHIENSPNNLCEAMMIGMPCLATFVGGTGSLLSDGEEGLLIQDGDPWVMAGAIKEMVNNQTQCINYGKKARTRALARHDKHKIVKELVDIYQAIILQEANKKQEGEPVL